MNARRWLAGSIGLCCGVAAGCSLDGRNLSLRGGGVDRGDAGGLDAGVRRPEPRLEVSPPGIDLGWVTMGFAARSRLTLTNSGDAPLPMPKIAWAAGSAPDFVVIQNRCDRDVAPGESCELRLQVVPSQAGLLEGTLQVQSEAAGAFDVPVAAEGLFAGDLILAPLSGSFEDYGGVLLGGAEEGTFTISNPTSAATGVLQLRVNRSEFAVADAVEGECAPGFTSLAPAESCNLRLAFAPAERGALDATLTVASEAAGSVSLTLAGRGLVPGAMATSAPALDFESVLLGQSARRVLTFANAGDEPIELTGATLVPEGAEGFAIQASDCGAGRLLEGGQSCSVQVEFRPPRADEELAAEVTASNVGAAQPLSVPLRGSGLLPGALEAAPLNLGEESFGDVLVGASLERAFVIGNPGAQPSGVLELSVSEGFEVVTPPAEGECQLGATSLVDGQTCGVRVRFSPTQRAPADGALTVRSPLAGSVGLPLSARGIVPGQIDAAPEVNFGRVLTAASAERTFTLTNSGDQPLVAPTIGLSGDPAQIDAFKSESTCGPDPLAVGASCEVTSTFAPTAAMPHAVTLEIESEGRTTSVLLLGEALVPGSLVLAAAEESSANFGDVEIGTSAERSFTLTNPGAVSSGALTISTDDNRFEAALGDCNQGDPAGLVDGSSCTFNVVFTPVDGQPAAANVSVQSPGAGRAGIQLSGRGRTKATLAGAGNRDMGRAILGRDAPTVPENEFAWTVSNTGDLATGNLVVSNSSPMEFVVGDDGCSGVALPNQGTCTIALRFRPAATGRRTGSLTVRDPVGMGSAVLAVTGQGEELAGPGESCVNAECATGVCTRAGRCCDSACDRSCQECSTGVCTELSGGEACGAGVCFGVDTCRAPTGAACGGADGDAQCGTGNCEARLGGANENDRICCDEDCMSGFACNTAGRCEQPALGAGVACDPAASRCGAGLDCKPCRGSGRNECTPVGECCADCGAGFQCSNGECRCTAANGAPGIDCGAGRCAIARDGACCPGGTPGCAGGVCDPDENLCRGCLSNDDCSSALPFCDTSLNVCRACVNDTHCTDLALPVCDAVEFVCKGCLANADCRAPGLPACDTTNRVCRACVARSDCAAPTPFCDTTENTCKPCGSSSDCAAPTPFCDTTENTCKPCGSSSDCAAPTPFCDTAENVCKPCGSNADCAGTGLAVCDTQNNVCTGCVADADCGAPVNGTIPACVGNACQFSCEAGFRECSGACLPNELCCLADGTGCCTDGDAICGADDERRVCNGGAFEPDPCPGGTLCQGAGECLGVAGGPCDSNDECDASTVCAPNGVCCNEECLGQCQSCGADGICRSSTTSGSCSPIFCPEHAPGCFDELAASVPPGPNGEGQCTPDGSSCALAEEVCPPALDEGTACPAGGGQSGTCQFNGTTLVFDCVADPVVTDPGATDEDETETEETVPDETADDPDLD